MDLFKKNRFFILIISLIATQLLAGLTTLYYVGFNYLPNRSLQEKQVECINHLQDKSYLLKQYFLENITNAERWVLAKDNRFFDTKWIGVAFYEHNGTDWILKNFQSNNILLDLYKITPTDYIKFEQQITGPHPDIRSLSIQDSSFSDQKILILESVNTLKSTVPHLIRVSLMSDSVYSILESNPSCPLALFNTKGFFLLPENNIAEVSYILRSIEKTNISDISISSADSYIAHTKKILKNIAVVQFLETQKNIYAEVFSQTLWINFCCLFIIGFLGSRHLRFLINQRINTYKKILTNYTENNFDHTFEVHPEDELSELDIPLSELQIRNKKKKK